MRECGVKPDRRGFLGAAATVALAGAFDLRPAFAQGTSAATTAMARMQELGPENAALAARVGLWDVTETVWAAPGAAPVTTAGLVAERRMHGAFLQEYLRPSSDARGEHVARIDYLSFNRTEGRYEYVSMDTRAPVGIMTAQSFTRGTHASIEVVFQPFTVPAAGSKVVGEMLRMNETIVSHGPDRDEKLQYFVLSDGTGAQWLAHRYAYVRRT